MRDFLRLMAPALKVTRERHEDPKNVSKGDYPTDIFVCHGLLNREMREVSDEVLKQLQHPSTETLEAMRYELGDVLLTAAIMLSAVEAELNGGSGD